MMSKNVPPVGATPEPRRLGRFELRRILGQGAQATVWLGHDTRLDRDVAVKILDPQADALELHQWLHEARAVSRLAHPHIVPVFEADEIDGQSCLIFEYVDGPTLAQLLKQRGALPVVEAVPLMLGILDALAAAHAQGIVHRDLKPSNVLVGRDGRPRVMDFGIAARIAGAPDGRIVGTAGYMSPEAARGEAPSPSMDVFAAGLMLGEMLTGRKLLVEKDPYAAIRRVQAEDIVLPAQAGVDDGLRALVARALARDAAVRFADAAAMREALGRWGSGDPVVPGDAAGGGTLEFLLRRMRHKSDFPALSTAISRIQRMATSDNENLNALSQEILKDVALTNKLLRMVNSAHFGQSASGGVGTVSRAIMLVGFAGIRNMALSLVLLEHMSDKAHAEQLKEEFLRSLMAGFVAGELSQIAKDTEEAFIGALFQNLGRLLAEFYFPEEADQIRALCLGPAIGAISAARPLDETAASTRVLGLSFEDLGVGVARSWGLPETLQQGMRKPRGEPPAKVVTKSPDRLRWMASAANEVADALMHSEPADAARRVAQLADRHARAIGAEPKVLRDAMGVARVKFVQMARALQIDLAPDSPARRLLDAGPRATTPEPDTLFGHDLQPTRSLAAPLADADAPTLVLAAPARQDTAQMLSAGIQDITDSMVDENVKLNQVLRMVMETMLRALDFRCVVFCMRDARTDTLTGRFGLGESASEVAAAFRVPLKIEPGAKPDLFSAVCLKGADTLIADVSSGALASRLPAWFTASVRAPTFLLLPMAMKGRPFGLIYADKAKAGDIGLDERELNLLRTLRNQAVMAFRQVGG